MTKTKTEVLNTQKDIDFLTELKKRLIDSKRDATQWEYAMNMIDDWINELETTLENAK